MTKQSLLSQHWKVAARVSDLSAVVSDIVRHLTAGHTLHTHCTAQALMEAQITDGDPLHLQHGPGAW